MMSLENRRSPKNPETFQSALLAAQDFDGTVAMTFEKSPAGIGVHEAHELAVEAVFGTAIHDRYVAGGGLRNRAPIELVGNLAPDARGNELDELTEKFVAAKLSVLMDEIGTRFPDGAVWPRPSAGYLEFRERIEEARTDDRHIDDAIISSGHEPFIKKTYEAWSINHPTHIVAVETMTRLGLGQTVKPSPVLMDVTRGFWRAGYGLDFDDKASSEELRRIVYAGDDPNKDGLLAANSGVSFVLVRDGLEATKAWQTLGARLGLAHAAAEGLRFHGE